MEIKRDIYLNQLIRARQDQLIKVVTGPRRCGKSYLLNTLFHNYLLGEGISEDHIIEISFEDLSNSYLLNPFILLEHIRKLLTDDQLFYVLLDEVQKVDRFVEVLNSLLLLKNVDVYVTGSNSKFLSSDIATEFRGRDHQIKMFPLSFSEYFSAVGGGIAEAWRDYYTYGGLPAILSYSDDSDKAQYLKNIFKTVYLADILERYKIKNDKELRQLITIMASGIGSSFNPTKISNTFKSVENVSIASQTIDKYLGYLSDAFLLNKADRYDVKGRKYIGTHSKFYFNDIGIRNAILNFRQQEETHIMENVIYNELCLRGYQVDIGDVEVRKRNEEGAIKRQHLEVDFVVNKASQRYYIQSAFSLPDEDKVRQESASLLSIDDTFKKIIVVKDYIKPWQNDKGILFISLFDFLQDPAKLLK